MLLSLCNHPETRTRALAKFLLYNITFFREGFSSNEELLETVGLLYRDPDDKIREIVKLAAPMELPIVNAPDGKFRLVRGLIAENDKSLVSAGIDLLSILDREQIQRLIHDTEVSDEVKMSLKSHLNE